MAEPSPKTGKQASRGLTAEEFRPFTDTVDSPMYVVTVSDGDERDGCLVGFLTQCSINPPRMLVCLSKANRTHQIALDTNLLGLHSLGENQWDLAELFGGTTGDDTDKFARCAWHEGPFGVPVLPGCRAVTVGRVLDRYDFGDHVGHLTEPLTVEADGSPHRPMLGLWQAEHIDPGHPA